MSGAEHSTELRVPKETGLTPVAFFCLFWDESIIQQLARATNAYARCKGNMNQQWRYPITVAELRTSLGITILIWVIPLHPITPYWTTGQVSACCSMCCYRYCQIKCFLHILMPENTASLSWKNWWRQLEPLSSHLRKQRQSLLLPGTHLSIDQMIISFTRWSFHTVCIPSKPIPRGYKVIALCSMGYTIDWILTARTESFAELTKLPDLSPTSSAVLQLCRSLDTSSYHFIIYMDNGFSTIPLFQKLREHKIGACGTTRVNRIGYPAALEEKVFMEWNTINGCSVEGVLCFQ